MLDSEGETVPATQTEQTQHYLRQFLQENAPLLLGIIRSYIVRMGMAQGPTVQPLATEVLHDAALEALAHADRLTSTTQPRAWFLVIATNILKRKRDEAIRQARREILISDLHFTPDAPGESDFFDSLTRYAQPGPEGAFEENEQVREMLALVAPADQKVLHLALVHDLDTRSVARALGITPGTARVRLYRAINRLRQAWRLHEQQEKEQEG